MPHEIATQTAKAVMPLPPTSAAAVDAVRELERASQQMPQVELVTEHAFWAGLYARTIMIPAGVCITGAQIKIPTMLIISGDVLVYGDGGPTHLQGYCVTLGQAGRKQAFYAIADSWLTMVFATDAKDVETAEREFTDEYESLGSHREGK